MAFVNERISEEDRKQYGLDQLWGKYRDDKSVDILSKAPYEWTIDKQNTVWLLDFAQVVAEWRDHGPGYTNEHIFLFYFQSECFEIRLFREEKTNFAAGYPRRIASYSTAWDLKSITPEPLEKQIFTESLKEALKEFGMDGTHSEDIKPQTTVLCNF